MDRNYLIELILLGIFMYSQGFSSGDWIEIDGCYGLNGNIGIVNRTNISPNEPGACLRMCTTNTVALQGSICVCISSEPTRKTESLCNISCSGDQRLRCGGDATVSVYKARLNISAEWRSLNGLGCMTYRAASANIHDGLFEQENCSANHAYYCSDEFKNTQGQCYRELKGSKTWLGALDDCRSGGSIHSHLWPANDECREAYAPNERFWVAVYQWTKVITTPITTSTTPTTSTSTTTRTSPTSTTSLSTSPSSTAKTSTSTTTRTSPTTPTKTSPSTTTTSPSISQAPTSTSTSASTTSSTTSKHNNSTITLAFKFTTDDVSEVESLFPKEARNFKIDAPNIGIGLGIGILLGFLISITIAYCRKRQRGKSSSSNQPLDDELMNVSTSRKNEMQANGHIDRHRGTSSSAINVSNFEIGTRKYDRNVNISIASKQEVKTGGKFDTSQGHHNAEENDDVVFSVDL